MRIYFVFSLIFAACVQVVVADEKPSIRIGWIGAMSGAVAKYGAYQAAMMAMDDINANGGIAGRKLELLFQDGKCSSKDAVLAANHLINSEHVKFIVGGHCSPESLPIAPIAQRAGVVMMAAITSSPKLSSAGDFIFRVTAPNTEGAQLLLRHVHGENLKSISIVYEETEYAQGLAEFMRDNASQSSVAVHSYNGFAPGEIDFRSLVSRLRANPPEAIYISPQSPDATVLFLKNLREQQINVPIFGNEIAGNTVKSASGQEALFEGMVFAEPAFDSQSSAVIDFEKRYSERFHVAALPYGFYTCEAYDAVRVVADAIVRCGDDPVAVKKCLTDLKAYPGLSGAIHFDQNGDGIRQYILKYISAGRIVTK